MDDSRKRKPRESEVRKDAKEEGIHDVELEPEPGSPAIEPRPSKKDQWAEFEVQQIIPGEGFLGAARVHGAGVESRPPSPLRGPSIRVCLVARCSVVLR